MCTNSTPQLFTMHAVTTRVSQLIKFLCTASVIRAQHPETFVAVSAIEGLCCSWAAQTHRIFSLWLLTWYDILSILLSFSGQLSCKCSQSQ